MSELNNILKNAKWEKIDDEVEQTIINSIVYRRPIDCETINLDCNKCKNLITTIEDVIAFKEIGKCSTCADIYKYNT